MNSRVIRFAGFFIFISGIDSPREISKIKYIEIEMLLQESRPQVPVWPFIFEEKNHKLLFNNSIQ